MPRLIKVDRLAFKIEIVWSTRLTSFVKIYRLPIEHKIIGRICLIGRVNINRIHESVLLVTAWVGER